MAAAAGSLAAISAATAAWPGLTGLVHVAEPLEDVQGALRLAGGLVVVPAQVSHVAELAVAVGHAGPVAEPLEDAKGAPVLARVI